MKHKYLLLLLAVLWMLPGKVVAQTENAGVYAYIESGTGDYNGKYILKFTNYAIEGGTQIDISTKEAPSLSAYSSSLVKVSFEVENDGEKITPTCMRRWFDNLNRLTEFEGLANLDTKNVTDMDSLFRGCSGLTSLDLSTFNTESVTKMNHMFLGCTSLTSLDVSSFNTSNVTTMRSMFNGCGSLTQLKLSNFDTHNVTTMYGMFDNCTDLTSLSVANFDTGKVTDMSTMFSNCSNLTTLDLSKFNTSNVTTMEMMFQSCSKLETLKLSSNFSTAQVTTMAHMFAQCRSLKKPDLSSFNTENVTDLSFMFQECTSLDSLDLSTFKTPKCTTVQYMFYNCSSLKFLDASNFSDESLVKNTSNMQNFARGCTALEEFRIGDFRPLKGLSLPPFDYVYGYCYTGVGTAEKPCHMVKGFTRDNVNALTTSNCKRDVHETRPPYYSYFGGYFYIADTLDASKDYTPVARTDGDLWVRNRTLKANTWSTIVLPAGITATELSNALGTGVEVDYLYKYDGDTLRFKTLTETTTANTPYLVKTATDVVNPAFVAVDVKAPASEDGNGNMVASASGTGKVSKTTATVTFLGNYNYHNTLSKGYFVLSGGKIKRSTGTAWVDPTRCYFQFSDIDENNTTYKAKYVAFDSFDDSGNYTTRIARIEAGGAITSADKAVYNLAGQRVGNDYKGIVIIGGKKILRR